MIGCWYLAISDFYRYARYQKIRTGCMLSESDCNKTSRKGSIKLWYNNYHEKLWLSKKNYYWLISEKPVKTNRNNSKIAKNLKSQNSAIFDDFRWFLKIVQNFFEIENFSWIKFFSCMKQKWVIILKNLKKFENGVRREILEDPKSEIQDILISWVTVENKLNNSEFTPL